MRQNLINHKFYQHKIVICLRTNCNNFCRRQFFFVYVDLYCKKTNLLLPFLYIFLSIFHYLTPQFFIVIKNRWYQLLIHIFNDSALFFLTPFLSSSYTAINVIHSRILATTPTLNLKYELWASNQKVCMS